MPRRQDLDTSSLWAKTGRLLALEFYREDKVSLEVFRDDLGEGRDVVNSDGLARWPAG